MKLDATAGSATANCYLTRKEADGWMARRLHTAAWDDAEGSDKDKALMWATRLIDRYQWMGVKATGTQALHWPRRYVTDADPAQSEWWRDYDTSSWYYAFAELSPATIPIFLQEATAELAFFLLQEDRTEDPSGIEFKRLEVGSLVLEPNSVNTKKVIPKSVMDIIRPYLSNPPDSTSRTLERA
jgi:hypothetical protein